MCRFRDLFGLFVLGLDSLASGAPLPGDEEPTSPKLILHEEGEFATDNSSLLEMKEFERSSPAADPQHIDETYLALVNGSPYIWAKTYIHQYQMPQWEQDMPQFIYPGESISILIQPTHGAGNWADSAAEVEYALRGTSEPMSFMIKFNNKGSSFLKVEYRGELASINNAKGSVHNLGINMYPGGSAFILAGKEGEFITNDPPIGWMQTLLPQLEKKPLREIVLPRSHHSGLWGHFKKVGLATPANAQTQTVQLNDQLGDGGIRVLDFRPLRTKDGYREIHGTRILDLFHGVMGTSLKDMIQIVNDFNRQNPGELIIWDVHGSQGWNAERDYHALDQVDRVALYEEFKALENRIHVLGEGWDLSKLELGEFIGNKTSAVIVNFDDSWRKMDGDLFPGSTEGYVTGAIFPMHHPWTNTDQIDHMVQHQVSEYRKTRPVPQSPIHITEWLLTQQGLGAAVPIRPITELARSAWRTLFHELWISTTSNSYPNWISVDNVRGNQLKALVMAMNHCLVAKQCGDLGGKVTFDEVPDGVDDTPPE
ncbi:uncharacterized protein TRIREDRAFT_108577 [Trichoderma reesei QM6a]|uniref:Predicted protein n=2 Tax=Hypocrea jecorina TaxID=51453 RepID=G0RM14_HYPJQ|nr:uncharacterized protein TRIREDRAFT_108577 [Trichoderma reesei QM6a]EGR47823.1 predicted protein [Trichoderma reesei QM6a]